MKVLGMMSGTSVDAVDGAIVDIVKHHDGSFKISLLFFGSYPFPTSMRDKINLLITSATDIQTLCQLNFELGKLYAQAAKYFIKKSNIMPELIANHGQTIYHISRRKAKDGLIPSTLQIGEPSFIALETGVPVVSDFRPADIAAGGEGAPLVPMADFILFHDKIRSISVHNIGGISNLTYLPSNKGIDGILAFDTGPGNTLIDAATYKLFNMPYDPNGEIAARGEVNPEILGILMGHPYFKIAPPKSTGREEFNLDELPPQIWDLAPEDVIATLTAFTAESIALAYRKFIIPLGLDEILVGGGGVYNRTLMKMIQERLKPIPVKPLSETGFNPRAREAAAFAILGYLTFNGEPGNVPSATGASRQVVLGKVTYPAGSYRMEKASAPRS